MKPETFLWSNYLQIITYVEKSSFEISEYKWVQFNRVHSEAFFSSFHKDLFRIGKKVLANCEKGSIDPMLKFGTKNPVLLGGMVRQWNIDWFTEKIMLVIGLNISGSSAEIFEKAREFQGHTDPTKANFKTIRRTFALEGESGIKATGLGRTIYNISHSPDSLRSFKREWGVIKQADTWKIL